MSAKTGVDIKRINSHTARTEAALVHKSGKGEVFRRAVRASMSAGHPAWMPGPSVNNLIKELQPWCTSVEPTGLTNQEMMIGKRKAQTWKHGLLLIWCDLAILVSNKSYTNMSPACHTSHWLECSWVFHGPIPPGRMKGKWCQQILAMH